MKPAATPAAKWKTRNVGEVYYRGVEATVTVPVFEGVSVAANGSFRDFEAKGAAGYTGKYALRPLTSTIGVRGDVARWERLVFAADARGFRRAGESEEHVVVNGHVTAVLLYGRLSVHLENLGGADYLDVTGKPVAGRSVSVGLAWP